MAIRLWNRITRGDPNRTLPQTTGASGNRLAWIDCAKGLTIVLIVLAHTLGKHYMRLDWEIDLPIRGAWLEFNRLFGPMRMPLFLMLSGLLASRSLELGGPRALVRRVGNPYLLYVIWLAITALIYAIFDPRGEIDGLELTPAGLVRNLAVPETTLWYIMALAVFYLGATVLRPMGAMVPIMGAALVSSALFAEWIVLPEWTGQVEFMLRYFPFFLVGALLPLFPQRVAGFRSRPLFATFLLGYLGVAVAFGVGADQVPFFGPIAGVLGAVMGILLAVRLASAGQAGLVLAWMGRHTLPIFVLHVPVLALFHWSAVGPAEALWAQFLGSPLAAAIYPAVVTPITVSVCLIVYAGGRRVGMGWVFLLPFGKQAAPTSSDIADPMRQAVRGDRRDLLGRTGD